jgi:hypothetical protein
LRLAAAAAALTATVLPALASACPACASRVEPGGASQTILLCSFIAVPFTIAAIVTKVIRSESARTSGASARPSTENLTGKRSN